jgi:Fe-S cluster assembly ATP-binding protein
MKKLIINSLTVSINNKKLIKNLSFSAQKGDVFVLMGQNGAGKTTLLKSIMKHFTTKIDSGEILIDDVNINNLKTDEIAKLGVFYILQHPIELEGIQTLSFLRMINDNKKENKLDFSSLFTKVQNSLKSLSLPQDIIQRDLNLGFSGGQKKKNEILQAQIFSPNILLIDEIDSGLDVDAIKAVAQYINSNSKNLITVVVSHNNDFIKLLKPTKVAILNEGQIVASGDKKIIDQIEKFGFSKFVGVKPRKMLGGACQIHKK